MGDWDLVVQGSEPTWQLRDGVVRSEVVLFRAGLLDTLFQDQDEGHGISMEYALRFRGDWILKNGGKVGFFDGLEVGGEVVDGGGRRVLGL